MAVDIIVVRDAGDKDGGSIQDPLLASVVAALARGFQEIEDAEDTESVSIECLLNQDITIGKLIAVVDGNYGQTWVGRATAVNHGQSSGMPITYITLRRKTWQT